MHSRAYFQPLLTARFRLVSLLTAKPAPPTYFRRPQALPPVAEVEAYPEALRISQTVIITFVRGSHTAVYSAYFEDPFEPAKVEVHGEPRYFLRANGEPVSLDHLTLESLASEAVRQACESRAQISICSRTGRHLPR